MKQTCKSCGITFQGNYCNRCGEKVVSDSDLRLHKLFGDLLNALTFADNKLLRTLRLIFQRPGQFSENFLTGVRVRFMRPLNLFFLSNFLYFLFPFFNTFNTNLDIQMNGLPHSTWVKEIVEARLTRSEIDLEDYRLQYDAKTIELSKLLLFAMVVFMAPFFWVFHFHRRGRLADHFFISLEVMIVVLLAGMLVFPLLLQLLGLIHPFSFSDFWLSITISGMLLYFFYRIERVFYSQEVILSLVFALIDLVILTVCLYLYRAFLFTVTFWSL